MSDVMLLGVLRMPMPDNPADMGGLEWAQVKDRMRQAADEIEKERAAVDGHIRLIEVLEDEVARLRAELAAADHYTDRIAQLETELANERKLKTIYFDEWQDANARERGLRGALEPFALWCDEMEREGPRLADEARVSSDVTIHDLRRARAVLGETK